jgi:hypothetical protein
MAFVDDDEVEKVRWVFAEIAGSDERLLGLSSSPCLLAEEFEAFKELSRRSAFPLPKLSSCIGVSYSSPLKAWCSSDFFSSSRAASLRW